MSGSDRLTVEEIENEEWWTCVDCSYLDTVETGGHPDECPSCGSETRPAPEWLIGDLIERVDDGFPGYESTDNERGDP